MLELDPHGLDRTLRDWAGRHGRFVRALLTNGDAPEHSFELAPAGLDGELHAKLVEKSALDPLAAPAARWLASLLVEHASVDAARRLARHTRLERRPIEAPERATRSYREVLDRALLDAPRRRAWLGALGPLGSHVANARFRLWEKKSERYAELRRTPLPLEAPARLGALAEELVASTDPAFPELRIGDVTTLLDAGIGREVRGKFPARLSTRALAELFTEAGWLDGLDFRLERPPEPAGASSFLRALSGFGAAFHDAGASRTRPFVVSHDALGLRRATFGALFGLLPLEASFAERRLDVGKSSSTDYLRELGRVVLVGTREVALSALLAPATFAGRSSYLARLSETAPRVLGFELPPGFEAWFADENASIRVAALLSASARMRTLRETHDEDWFRNPRAVAELRAELESPPPTSAVESELEAGANELAHTLRAVL